MVGDKDESIADIEKSWSLEKRPQSKRSATNLETFETNVDNHDSTDTRREGTNSCNTGPAILYTAIVVTLLHCGIMLGGYFYYRRFGYSGKGKLFRPASFSTENISQATLTPHHPLSLSHSNLHHNNQHNTNSLQQHNNEPRSNQDARNSGGGGGGGHVNNGFNFGDFESREIRTRDVGSRPERTNQPLPTTSSNNANVFYGPGPHGRDSFRENAALNPSHSGNAAGGGFRSLYSGVYGSPP